MDKSYIRTKTVLIVEKDRRYLIGCGMVGVPRWSNSPYDAWQTRNMDEAETVSSLIDGKLFLFNPLVGQLRECCAML